MANSRHAGMPLGKDLGKIGDGVDHLGPKRKPLAWFTEFRSDAMSGGRLRAKLVPAG